MWYFTYHTTNIFYSSTNMQCILRICLLIRLIDVYSHQVLNHENENQINKSVQIELVVVEVSCFSENENKMLSLRPCMYTVILNLWYVVILIKLISPHFVTAPSTGWIFCKMKDYKKIAENVNKNKRF